MSSQQDSIDKLDPTLVFSRFGQLSTLRKNLYKDYESIDENEEIAKDWLDFSETIVDHLLFVIELTKSLYDRIVDELKRAPAKAEMGDLKRLQAITSFWLEIGLLSYSYATLGKTKLFKDYGGKATVGYYKTRLSFDELLKLGFSQQASFTPDSLATLLDLLKQDQLRKHLGYFQEYPFSENDLGLNKSRPSLLAEYDFNQAIFILKDVSIRLGDASTSWWWRDPIGMYGNLSHALMHLDKARENEDKITSDLKQKIISFYEDHYKSTQLVADAYLAFHYRTLAKHALIKKDIDSAIKYFEQASHLIRQHGTNRALFAQLAWSNTSIVDELHTFEFAMVVAKASRTYTAIVNQLKEGITENIEEMIKSVNQLIVDTLKKGDVPLLSSMLLVYDNIYAYLMENLDDKQHIDTERFLKFLESRMELLEERLNQAFQQISTDWMSAVSTPSSESHELEHISKNLDILELAILLLPTSEKFKQEAQIQLNAIEEASEALLVGRKAEEEFGKNPVKELMIRAKTYFLITHAIMYTKNQNLEQLSDTIEKFLRPIAENALLRGLIAEIQLRTALLQYAFINKVAEIIDSSVIGSKTLLQGLNVKHDVSEMNEFKKSMQELLVTVETLIENKKPIKIKGSAVNWLYFQTLYANISGAIYFIDAITSAIKASDALQTKKFELAAQKWNEAKNLTFKAANEVAKGGSPESSQVSEQLFTIGTMFGEMEQSARDHITSPKPFPEEILITALQALVMT